MRVNNLACEPFRSSAKVVYSLEILENISRLGNRGGLIVDPAKLFSKSTMPLSASTPVKAAPVN
jgi:hypothetical protein